MLDEATRSHVDEDPDPITIDIAQAVLLLPCSGLSSQMGTQCLQYAGLVPRMDAIIPS